MLHFARDRSPGKMQKSLAKGRLPGVLPGAEYPANLLIANDPARALAPGKCAPGTGPGSTPGKLLQTFLTLSGRYRLLQMVTSVNFKPCQGLTPGKMCTNFFF
jgi:hypothetical protein